MNILVVEDDPQTLAVVINAALNFNEPNFVESLKQRGIVLEVPRNPPQCITNLADAKVMINNQPADQPFDLVILDLLIRETASTPVDTEKGNLLGYELLKALRDKFGNDVPVVIYSNYLDPNAPERDRAGTLQFLDLLRERNVAPPDEILWKERYFTPERLMRKLVRYAIDLNADDEKRLREANILVPKSGATRRVLRELKRMACSASIGFPRSDVLLLGENGVGKTTFARAYHLLRPKLTDRPQLGFEHLDLGSLDFAGSAPNISLFGATDFNGAWSLGAFARSTLYKRPGKKGDEEAEEFLQFPGQELEPSSSSSSKVFAKLGDSSYPKSTDRVDFDGSGTLFLDEVVNIGIEVQAMLLQALSYDLHSRHVYTTGHAPRRLSVAPSLVFATAQPLETNESTQDDQKQFRHMKDYLFRIDQTRVTIPPLRDREPREILQLLKELVMRRRPKTSDSEQEIQIDPVIEPLLKSTLVFRNNVADLQRIADQVMPEEPTISWQHVGPLFERERPIIAEASSGQRTGNLQEKRSDTYAHARKTYARYLAEFVEKDEKLTLSQLPKRLDVRQTDAYNVGLIFMDDCGCSVSKRWPREEQTIAKFDHGAKAFQTYLHRISPYRSGSFSLKDALNDLAKLKDL